MSERELTYGEAVKEAIAEEMRRDPRVFLIGEDVAEAGHPFKTLVGLVEEFGVGRVIDTPISEPGYAGIGVGAAMTGMRPVVDVMFGDFITLTMDQMVNQAAKAHYMSGGRIKVPIVFRTTLGATRRSAAQHSQSLHAWVSHIPGLKVALPSSPYEAKGLMKTAIRDDSPVVIFEDKMMYRVKGPVPALDYTIPFGVAEIKRAGTDVTIVATSSMVQVALDAATLLADAGISAEVIDPRTTYPLDKQTLIESAKKTSRVIVVDEGYERYGVTAEIAAVIAEGEVMQLITAKNTETTEDDYLAVIDAKTAALFAAAAEVGAVIAARPRSEAAALRSYGRNLGLAFQLVDDALDYSGEPSMLGKSVGDDFREGKITLPVVLCYRRGNAAERAFWQRTLQEGDVGEDDLAEAFALMKRHTALNDTMERARHYGAIARDALAIFPDGDAKAALLEAIEFCVDRRF